MRSEVGQEDGKFEFEPLKVKLLIKKFAAVLSLALAVLMSGQSQDSIGPEERYLESRIEQRQLNRDRWQDLAKSLDYTERERRKRNDRNENFSLPEDRSITPFSGGGIGAGIARFLLILLGAVGIALLVRAMLGYGSVNNKKILRNPANAIDIEKIEEDLHEADLNNYIEQAKRNGDFNLAIRLYYLAILKELSLQKKIKWKVDKTNNEYIREMRNQTGFAEFRQLTNIFERSWYGYRMLDAGTFNQLEPDFQAFIHQLFTTKSTAAV